MRLRSAPIFITAGLALLPSAAFAHTGFAHEGGFLHGFAHPLSGLDHVLAMVLVGLFACQIGGRALWWVPATFVAMMVAGWALAMAGIAMPFVELGIALSVVVFGVVVALGFKAPLAVGVGIAGLFAAFHGHAHGAEMPAAASGLAYAAGFIAATVFLHAGGIALGLVLARDGARHGWLMARSAGGVAALAGIGIMAGAL